MHNKFFQYQFLSRCPSCKNHHRYSYSPNRCYVCGASWGSDSIHVPYGLFVFLFFLFMLFAMYTNYVMNVLR